MACVIEVRDQELYVMVAHNSRGKTNVSRAFRIYLSDSLFKNNEIVITDALINQIKNTFENHNIRENKVQASFWFVGTKELRAEVNADTG